MSRTHRPGRRLPIRLYRWASHVLYHQLAWAYDAVSWIVSTGRWSHWRRAALAHLSGPRVLDIGFGTGELLIEMSVRGLQAYGLELSPAMHRVTARKLRRRGLKPPRVRARAQSMPFASRSFNSAVSTFPAWYILDPATLHEAARVIGRADSTSASARPRFVIVGLFTGIGRRRGPNRGAAQLTRTDTRILEHIRPLAVEVGLDLDVVASPAGWNPPLALLTKCAGQRCLQRQSDPGTETRSGQCDGLARSE